MNTNLFPLMMFLSVVTTNWINNNNWMRVDNTNYVGQRQVITTNLYLIEVTLCTNRTIVRQTSDTTGPTNGTRWVPVVNGVPPLPNVIGRQ